MKYGFIGCGNMGGAIATALSRTTKDILVADPGLHSNSLTERLGIMAGLNKEVAEKCDRIFLAVKPQILADVVKQIAPVLADRKPLIITMAAGITIARIEELIGASLPVIRIMPNTPVSVGKGMILYCRNEQVADEVLTSFLADMQHTGRLDALDEELIDAASALSGSGPAYMYLLLDAMADGAAACGLSKEKSILYAAATMEGAAQMLMQTQASPEELKNAVCSPGGSTLAGLKVLEDHAFRESVINCIIAAHNRNKELGK